MLSSTLATLSSQARRGFTLIEIAIVLVVIGLITSGGLLAVSPVIQSAKISETKQKIATVEAALLGYVIVNGCLPCPASRGSAATGLAQFGSTTYTSGCNTGTCVGTTAGEGLVPWITLGLSENEATDAWNRRLTYGVEPLLTVASSMQRTSAGAFPTTTSTVRIDNLAGTNQNYTSVAYVIVSHGPDGAFGEASSGNLGTDTHGTATNIGQRENGDNDLAFAYGPPSGQGAGFFDDIIVFKSYQPVILSCGAGSCGNPS